MVLYLSVFFFLNLSKQSKQESQKRKRFQIKSQSNNNCGREHIGKCQQIIAFQICHFYQPINHDINFLHISYLTCHISYLTCHLCPKLVTYVLTYHLCSKLVTYVIIYHLCPLVTYVLNLSLIPATMPFFRVKVSILVLESTHFVFNLPKK